MPYACPNNCEDNYLYMPPCCLYDFNPDFQPEVEEDLPHPEMGVVCDSDGKLTNQWVDGTVGVPDYIEVDGCGPECSECGEECIWTK